MDSHEMSEEARESFARLNEFLKREQEAKKEAERFKRGNLTSIERASLLLIREAKR